MLQGNREEMKINAKNLGAIPQGTVNKSTDILVCVENVGSTKLNKARDIGVKMLSESEYLSLISA